MNSSGCSNRSLRNATIRLAELASAGQGTDENHSGLADARPGRPAFERMHQPRITPLVGKAFAGRSVRCGAVAARRRPPPIPHIESRYQIQRWFVLAWHHASAGRRFLERQVLVSAHFRASRPPATCIHNRVVDHSRFGRLAVAVAAPKRNRGEHTGRLLPTSSQFPRNLARTANTNFLVGMAAPMGPLLRSSNRWLTHFQPSNPPIVAD